LQAKINLEYNEKMIEFFQKADDHSVDSILCRVGESGSRDWYASKLDGIGQHASKQQNDRFDLAVSYLETHCWTTTTTGQEVVDREKVLQQLDSIDFHKPVTLQTFKPCDELVQHSIRDKSQTNSFELNREKAYGEFFTMSGVPSQRLAITERDETRRCSVKTEMVVLESHTRGTVDVWSKNRPVRTPPNHTEKGTTILNCDRTQEFAGLKLTSDPKQARSVFHQSNPTRNSLENKKTLKHRSGEYVAGGGVQYHIPKRKDKPELCRHRDLTPVKFQKRGSITR